MTLVTLIVGGTIVTNIRVRRMARRRAGEGFSDFAASFVNRNVPHEVLLNTYNYFGEWNRVAGELFPVRATDNISNVYGCVEEDLDDAVGEILEKSGRRWPTHDEVPQPPAGETIEDVVLYVAAAPVAPVGNGV
ncbi:MAG TPA: hypothetical protein VGB61_00975 [Pyrinomonadaceae bacterium]